MIPLGVTQQASGGGAYDPGMMTYGGGYYSNTSMTTTGNKITVVCRFNRAAFSGDVLDVLFYADDGSDNIRMQVLLWSDDYSGQSTRWQKLQMSVENSSNTVICSLISSTSLTDGADHVLHASFDGDSGLGRIYVDNVDEDDTGHASRVAPTTGTLGSGASSRIYVGASTLGVNIYGGDAGFVGCHDVYLTNDTAFSTGSTPLELDEVTWTEWGSQPLVWQDEGNLSVENLGSLAVLTKTGTITGPT